MTRVNQSIISPSETYYGYDDSKQSEDEGQNQSKSENRNDARSKARWKAVSCIK